MRAEGGVADVEGAHVLVVGWEDGFVVGLWDTEELWWYCMLYLLIFYSI